MKTFQSFVVIIAVLLYMGQGGVKKCRKSGERSLAWPLLSVGCLGDHRAGERLEESRTPGDAIRESGQAVFTRAGSAGKGRGNLITGRKGLRCNLPWGAVILMGKA